MSDSVKGLFNKLIDKRAAKYDRYAFYPCKVVSQNADGSLDLKPDNPAVPAPSNVPIRYGMPGVAVQMSGGRVLLGFEGGDPTRPIAALFENSGITTVFLGGSNATGSDVANYVALANLVLDRLNSIQSNFDGHTHKAGMALICAGSGSPATGYTGTPADGTGAIDRSIGTMASVAATKVKAL